jgi:hypothetical protein
VFYLVNILYYYRDTCEILRFTSDILRFISDILRFTKSARKMSRKGKDATSDSSPRTVKITAFSSSRTVQKTKPSSGEVIPGVNTEAGAHTPDNSHMTTGGQTSTPTHDGSEFPYEIDASAIHPEISCFYYLLTHSYQMAKNKTKKEIIKSDELQHSKINLG